MSKKTLDLIPPGEILLEEFLIPMNISQNRLARSIGVSPGRINEIVKGKAGISAEMVLRFSRFFGTSAYLWLNLQTDYDLQKAEWEKWEEIDRQIQPYKEKNAA